MPLQTWLLFVATVCLTSATPGPNMLLAMNHGINHGIRRTALTCAGLMTGLVVIMVASAAGLGAILAASELLFSIIKYAGAAYLIYIGVKTWRAVPEAPEARAATAEGKHNLFGTGFLVALSNPKAFIFFTAFFPQFMDKNLAQGPQLITLALTFFVIEASWQFVYASGGARLATWFKDLRRVKILNRVAGSAFIGAGIVLTAARRI